MEGTYLSRNDTASTRSKTLDPPPDTAAEPNQTEEEVQVCYCCVRVVRSE